MNCRRVLQDDDSPASEDEDALLLGRTIRKVMGDGEKNKKKFMQGKMLRKKFVQRRRERKKFMQKEGPIVIFI